MKIKSALKSTGKPLKTLEKSLKLFTVELSIVDRDLNHYKLLCLYLVQHVLHQIKAQHFYTNFLILISPLSQYIVYEVEF